MEILAVGVDFRRRELFLVAAAHGCEELVAALRDFHLAVRDVVLRVAELAPQLLDELLAIAQRFLCREDGRKRRLLAVEVYGMDVRRITGDAVVRSVDGRGELVEVLDERKDAVVAAANVPLDVGDGRSFDFTGRADRRLDEDPCFNFFRDARFRRLALRKRTMQCHFHGVVLLRSFSCVFLLT